MGRIRTLRLVLPPALFIFITFVLANLNQYDMVNHENTFLLKYYIYLPIISAKFGNSVIDLDINMNATNMASLHKNNHIKIYDMSTHHCPISFHFANK